MIVEATRFDSIWIVYQAFKQSENRSVPMEVTLKSGSVEIIIPILKHVLSSGVVQPYTLTTYGAILGYILGRKQEGKSIKVVRVPQDVLVGYGLHWIEEKTKMPVASVERVRRRDDDTLEIDLRLEDGRRFRVHISGGPEYPVEFWPTHGQ